MSGKRIQELASAIAAKWREAGVQLEPTPESTLEGFQRRYRVDLPIELAPFYRVLGGMDVGGTDEEMIRFWPLADVRTVAEELGRRHARAFDGYYIFADFLICSHFYAFSFASLRRDVVIVGLDEPIPVAPSFESFLEKYLSEPDSLFL